MSGIKKAMTATVQRFLRQKPNKIHLQYQKLLEGNLSRREEKKIKQWKKQSQKKATSGSKYFQCSESWKPAPHILKAFNTHPLSLGKQISL